MFRAKISNHITIGIERLINFIWCLQTKNCSLLYSYSRQIYFMLFSLYCCCLLLCLIVIVFRSQLTFQKNWILLKSIWWSFSCISISMMLKNLSVIWFCNFPHTGIVNYHNVVNNSLIFNELVSIKSIFVVSGVNCKWLFFVLVLHLLHDSQFFAFVLPISTVSGHHH